MLDVNRPIKERSKSEIEAATSKMGDYVKMSYLQRALRSSLDFETKRYVLVKLASIYEARRMYLEGAKMIKAAAEINKTFREKRADYMKAVYLYVKAGDFVEADRMFVQALALGNDAEKMEMKSSYKDYYIKQADEYIKAAKRNQAKQFYEKALTLDLQIGERSQIQKRLLDLYEKLGNVKEYMNLKKSL